MEVRDIKMIEVEIREIDSESVLNSKDKWHKIECQQKDRNQFKQLAAEAVGSKIEFLMQIYVSLQPEKKLVQESYLIQSKKLKRKRLSR